MAPRERQKPFRFLDTSVDKQILKFTFTGWLRQFHGFYSSVATRDFRNFFNSDGKHILLIVY